MGEAGRCVLAGGHRSSRPTRWRSAGAVASQSRVFAAGGIIAPRRGGSSIRDMLEANGSARSGAAPVLPGWAAMLADLVSCLVFRIHRLYGPRRWDHRRAERPGAESFPTGDSCACCSVNKASRPAVAYGWVTRRRRYFCRSPPAGMCA